MGEPSQDHGGTVNNVQNIVPRQISHSWSSLDCSRFNPPDEIVQVLADLLGGPASLIEQTTMRDALMALMLTWSEGVKGIDGLVESVTSVAQNIEGARHVFFGHYILEVFKTVGYQGVLANHGFEKAESMAGQIRDFINAKIDGLQSSRALSSVDWNGASGAAIVDGIVADTISIFGEAHP